MFNKIILVGRLGDEPEVFDGKSKVARFPMATDRKWTNRETGERQEETEWHQVTVFGRLAEVVEDYMFKGQLALVEGRVQTDKWTDDSGETHYRKKVIAQSIQMLSYPDEDRSQEKERYQEDDFEDDLPF